MPAIGFGQKVTGAGNSPDLTLNVTDGGDDDNATGTLRKRLQEAEAASKETPRKKVEIVIGEGVVVQRRAAEHIIKTKNLTITGSRNSKIVSNQLYFDCRKADNVLLRNLTFEGNPGVDEDPKDAIFIDGALGRKSIGFWISHCRFEAYRDLNITLKATDLAPVDNVAVPPLLITISDCFFHNADPDAFRDIGAISIAGVRDDSVDPNAPGNRRTNAYATVCFNMFETVRRRSPRSSGRCVVHAFDNVLELYGGTTGDQRNGMESGSNGILIAEANSFIAGTVPQTIKLSTTPTLKGTLTINDDDSTLKNTYGGGAVATAAAGTQVVIDDFYTARGIRPVPVVQKMTRDLGRTIKASAGPQFQV
jgi:pectate lyase